jgi:hypothetical protein
MSSAEIKRAGIRGAVKWTAISVGVLGAGLAVVSLIACVARSREGAQRGECVMHMHQIALALWSYQDKHGSLPPAVVRDANGNPAHSWRVLILPYLDAQEIYDKYDFSEPWNGPNNSRLQEEFHRAGSQLFYCALSHSRPDGTNYVAVTGPGTLWPTNGVGVLSDDMMSGAKPLAIVVEVPGMNINWMEPKDISIDDAMARILDRTGSQPIHSRGIQYLNTAQRLRLIPAASTRSELKKIFLIDDARPD